MSSARGQYRRASLEDDDLIDPDDGRNHFRAPVNVSAKLMHQMQRTSTTSTTLSLRRRLGSRSPTPLPLGRRRRDRWTRAFSPRAYLETTEGPLRTPLMKPYGRRYAATYWLCGTSSRKCCTRDTFWVVPCSILKAVSAVHTPTFAAPASRAQERSSPVLPAGS